MSQSFDPFDKSQEQLSGLLKQFYELPFIGIAISSPTTRRWVRFNDRLCEILGRSREEVSQATWDEVTHPDDLAADIEQFERVIRGEIEGYSLDKRFVRKDGTICYVKLDVRCSRREDGSVEHLFATVQDITERKEAETKIERLTRTYATLSECNQAIVRCSSAEELFAKICEIAVQQGGMQMAWVGLLDPETLRVNPVASCGDATNHLADAVISADASSPFGQGVTGTAIREKRSEWIQDYNTDPRTAPWRGRALRAGWNATGALPLIVDGQAIGAFVLNADVPHAFDEQVRQLLSEMAGDISFALDRFAKEKARREAEANVERLTRMYAALSDCNQSIVRCTNEDELFPRVCEIAVRQGGMQMAWVGLIDQGTKRVRPAASFGEGTEALGQMVVSVDPQSPYGQGAAGRAVRAESPVWIQDSLDDPITAPWREMAERYGWRSTAVLPLRQNDQIIGVFILLAREQDAFDEIVRNLLVEMSMDISFALTNYVKEEARRQAEAKVARLTHIYAALSECNQAIVRCSGAEELFPQVCRFAVEFGGMKLAWIGWVDQDTQMIRPAASFGEGTEVLRDIVISTDANSPLGQGAAGKAVRELSPFWVQDYLNDPVTAPWHEQGRRFGWRASAVLPLTRNDVAVGVFVLLSGEQNAFDEAVRNLLVEMAMDISFALTTFGREQERLRMHEALRESESRFRELYEKAPLPYQSLDVNGNIVEVNEAWLTLLGRTREEVIGRFVGDFLTQTSLRALPEKLRNFQSQEGGESPLFQFVRKDGECRLVMVNARMSRGSDGEFKRIHCILSDLTERMRTEEQLHLTSKVFEQGGEGVMITDDQARILKVNRAFEMITGYTQDEVIGRNPRFLSSGRHDREFFRTLWETINRAGFWQGEIWNRRKDGDVFPEYLTLSRIVDEQGAITHYIATFNDISESKASQEHIQRLAHYDSLTGLPNRMLLADRADLALSRMERNGEQLAMIFLDLDRFKNVNDSLGHRVGDELLIQVAGRLKGVLREEDTVSRLGGDEFIMLLPSTDADGATHVAGKVLADLSRPYHIEHYELSVTPSMGIAMYPADGASYEALSMCADTAMYRAKQGGRQTFRFFTREMQERSDRTLQLENALRRALELDQLRLNYQPQVSLENRRVIGVEALLRWRHPDLGEVGPSDFIPVAEDSGLILPIGEWVLRSAVRQMRAWIDGGLPPMVMAVNLSAIQFRQSNLPQLVSQILADVRLPPNLLEFELTERVAMENPLEAIEIMNELHALGIRMSIDDFGTGYSALSYLKRFKVYKLKIDRSFVQDISMDPDDEAIVDGIIGLSRSLGLKTIAEGVETEEQSAFLRAKGCHEGQGFLFSRPVPAGELENFVRASWNKTPNRN